MPESKLQRKWFSLIWFSLIFASLVKNAYAIYYNCATLADPSAAKIALEILIDFVFNGVLPAVLTYLCASVLFSMAWRRGLRFSSRDDFIYISMIFTAAAYVVMGLIDIFSILAPVISIYTSTLLPLIVLPTAYLLMYFLVFAKRYMNVKVAYHTLSLFSSVYLTVLAVLTLLPCVSVFILQVAGLPESYMNLLMQMGYPVNELLHQPDLLNASIAAFVLFFVLTAVIIALCAALGKKAKKYVEPEFKTPFGGHGSDGGRGGNPFEDFEEVGVADDKNDNVFDEFDI